MDAEFAGPQWVFGLTWYGIDADGTVISIVHRQERDELWRIPAGAASEGSSRIPLPHSEIYDIVVSDGRAEFGAGRPDEPAGIVLLDLASGDWRYVRRASEEVPPPGAVSVARHIEFPTSGGISSPAHALFYPPVNSECDGPPTTGRP